MAITNDLIIQYDENVEGYSDLNSTQSIIARGPFSATVPGPARSAKMVYALRDGIWGVENIGIIACISSDHGDTWVKEEACRPVVDVLDKPPAVGIDSQGNIRLYFFGLTSDQNLYHVRKIQDSGWESMADYPLNAYGDTFKSNTELALAVDNQDEFHLVWQYNRLSPTFEYAIAFVSQSNAGPGQAVSLTTQSNGQNYKYPCIATSGGINEFQIKHIAFTDENTTSNTWYAFYVQFASLTIPPNLSYETIASGPNIRVLGIATDSMGIPHVIWKDIPASPNGHLRLLYSKRVGGVWTAPEVIIEGTGNTQNGPYDATISIDINDVITVVYGYQSTTNGIDSIQYKQNTGGVWSGATTIETYDLNDVSFISLNRVWGKEPAAMFPAAGFAFTTTIEDYSGGNDYVNRYFWRTDDYWTEPPTPVTIKRAYAFLT